jgi:hypothetical protein
MVASLGYALWVALKHLLQRRALGLDFVDNYLHHVSEKLQRFSRIVSAQSPDFPT